jgi:ABC-type polysaccharide/polyol phosphate transport system ATPase subunit
MSKDNAIEVKNVKKKFKVYYDKGRSLKEKILFKNRNRYETRWVLNGIDFEVKRGEAIGLIGHNGCGKSTTLKLLTRIMYPDEGTIEMNGRVSSLIELGAGFHPDMSGRENIYTNASIFGLTRKEIDARIKDIIEFSEMEEFLDNPVRTYSSGMYMRLAFSVAINVDADILLIDEILAVGDANFQAKCINKLRNIKALGTTIVIVSHSLAQIEQFCDRSIWIQDGMIQMEGKPRDVHPAYMDFMGHIREVNENKKINRNKEINNLEVQAIEESDIKTTEEVSTDSIDRAREGENDSISQTDNKRWGNGHTRIIKIEAFNRDRDLKSVFCTGEDIILQIHYNVFKKIDNAVFGIGIFRGDGLLCYGTNTRIDNISDITLEQNGICEIVLSKVNLLPGEYIMDIAIECDMGIPVDYFKSAFSIEMYSSIDDIGLMRIDHTWNILKGVIN